MIVCICSSVSDHAIRAARDARAGTLDAIAAATGAGTDCGCCTGTIERILAEPAAARPCKAEPCAGCPRRAAPAGAGAVPTRAAAGPSSAP